MNSYNDIEEKGPITGASSIGKVHITYNEDNWLDNEKSLNY